MKKSLILSVVMTLVLVISMSTATFAWYTANNSVTATVSNIEAASASGDLKVAMSEQDASSTAYAATRTFAEHEKILKPIAPAAVLSTDIPSATWKGYNVVSGTATDNNAAFGSDVVTGTITLSNAAPTATGAISVTVDVTGENATNTEVVLVYNDVIVYNSAYRYGATADATSAVEESNTLNTALSSIGTTPVELTYYIWFDGFTIANADMSKIANVKFTFTAA